MEEKDLTRGIYRLIYSGAIRGRRINRVSVLAELLFWRAHLVADDFGAFEADPVLFRAQALTLRPNILEGQIRDCLDELAREGLIQVYHVRGEPYAIITDFLELQPAGRNGRRVRRFPPPPSASEGRPGNPGESGGIQGNPGETSTSAQEHTHTQAHTQTQQQVPPAGWPKAVSDLERDIGPVCELVNAYPSLLAGGMARVGPTQRADLERIIELSGGVEAAKGVMARVVEAKTTGKKITSAIRYALGMIESERSEAELKGAKGATFSRKKVYCDA